MIDPVMPVYARASVSFVRGEGAYLYDDQGRRYLDFGAGVAVISLGHCHPHLVAALKRQAETLWHCSNLYRIPEQERLAKRLVANSFADSVFFSNSGAEANEALLKMTRKYHYEAGDAKRWRVIVCEGAFHGRTLATIAAGGQAKHLKGFGPTADGFDRVSFGNLNEARAAIGPETAAILIEPIQGEGGVRAADKAYMRGLRALADEFGILLCFDEVQSGMGRTGKLFAHEWAEIEPDIVATAKGLGGGFPIGATLASEKVARAMMAGSHGSTFGGNPLAAAVGNAVLDVVLADGFMAGVDKIARKLWGQIEGLKNRHPGVIAEVRGAGLLVGMKMIPENLKITDALMKAGLLAVPAGDNVVRLVPPLIIDENHVHEAVTILDSVCRDVAGKAA